MRLGCLNVIQTLSFNKTQQYCLGLDTRHLEEGPPDCKGFSPQILDPHPPVNRDTTLRWMKLQKDQRRPIVLETLAGQSLTER